jgi:hypothetical protein
MDVADMFVALTSSNQPLLNAGSFIVSASIECVLVGVLIVNGPTRSTHTMTQGYSVRFCYFGLERTIFLALLLCHLSFDILDKWKINNQCSTSCVKPGHAMVFLLVFSALVCPGWSKYSWYQDSTLCLLSQLLKNIDLVCYLCSKEDHTLQYVVLSNEVGLSPLS